VNPATLMYGTVWENFYKTGSAATVSGQGPPAQDDGVYDGVIVRAPWRWLSSDPLAGVVGKAVQNIPNPTKPSKVTDGMSKTMMVAEKYIRADLYAGGTPSDDTGWSDGWDPDVMRCTCVPPINDADVNFPYTGRMGDAPGNPVWETFLIGAAHTGGF